MGLFPLWCSPQFYSTPFKKLHAGYKGDTKLRAVENEDGKRMESLA